MPSYVEKLEYKEEVLSNQTIQLRTTTIVLKDGVEVGRQYHREVFYPGDDVTAAPAEVQAIASALWSDEVITAYQLPGETEA